MDLSIKRNTEIENENQPTLVPTTIDSTPPVVATETRPRPNEENINKPPQTEDTMECQNQEIEDEGNKMSTQNTGTGGNGTIKDTMTEEHATTEVCDKIEESAATADCDNKEKALQSVDNVKQSRGDIDNVDEVKSLDLRLKDCGEVENLETVSSPSEPCQADKEKSNPEKAKECEQENVECDEEKVDEKKVEGDDEMMECDDKEVECDEKVMEGDEKVMEGDEKVMEGDEKVMEGDEKVMEGDEKVMEGDEKVMEGDEKVMEGDEKVMEGDEKVMVGDEKEVECDEKGEEGDAEKESCDEKEKVNDKEMEKSPAKDGSKVGEESIDNKESEEKHTMEIITNENETKKENGRAMEDVEADEEQSLCMPPENLFEYQWPPEIMGEWFFVQEQICEYLGVTSFKRKYPDLERRVMEMKEKEFLRERGVVTEEQVTLGLTALKSEDVYDLMAKDYNKKYTNYLKVLQEKERQNISNKHKEYEAPTMDTEKVKEYTKRAVRQAAEYNASLMRERKEERQYFLDMQTMVVQVSKNRVKQTKKEITKVDGYPVALIPGQYQNFYRKYTPDELNYFPLTTALYGPVHLQDQKRLGRPGWEDEEEPISDISEPGTPEPPSAVPVSNVPPPAIHMIQLETPQKEQHQTMMPTYKPKIIDDAICGLCLKDKACNKFNIPEELIHCAQCDNSGHPSCLEMNDDLVNEIKTYPWQCMECKTCFCCGQPTDEDKMMFCDDCDRGYHTFCVGLQEIPTGKWACPSCLASQAKEKELAAAALLAAAAAATPIPEPVNTPSATPPPTKRRRTAKKRDL
ncbi:uncharacterized protein [Antedon mediterranea]|uniref:uncharacterized protein n=1 Tax=Antedon mediterranea TaxID=105859 RepID=UPI003AF7775C